MTGTHPQPLTTSTYGPRLLLSAVHPLHWLHTCACVWSLLLARVVGVSTVGSCLFVSSADSATSLQACIEENTCPDCVLPLDQTYPYAQRVHTFLYAIKLTSVCCQVCETRPTSSFIVVYPNAGDFFFFLVSCASRTRCDLPLSSPAPPPPRPCCCSPLATAVPSTPPTSPCCTL